MDAVSVLPIVTRELRTLVQLREEIARWKKWMDLTNLMVDPYNLTQAQSDVVKGAVNAANAGLVATTWPTIEQQAGFFSQAASG